ncbi:MAG: homoserine kinase [Bacillota bacterium]|jgi:homoserine kinase|nr:homoserine kinase [Bacillota bacterium]NLU54720.1 homoserine kinase [Bacillota bacterium]HOA90874.1 homoserine kinase [Bacillota bacterium]HPT61138.1 homoserine kinase [Bacillota bacterium]HPZ72523.1 homoserine kinase [Bacillota bacterium]
MKVLAPATTANLGPGFDLLGASLDMENEIWAEFADSYFLQEEGYSEGTELDDHLVCKVMRSFLMEQGISRPFALKAKNRIPFARGLGSSSAAIVGGLVLANALAGSPLDAAELLRRAVEIEGHPDNVAPALLGGVVLAAKDTYISLPAPQVSAFVLIPDFKVSTEKARRILPQTYSREVAVRNSSRLSQLVIALERGDSELFLQALDDEIHQPFRGQLIPGYDALSAQAVKLGGRIVISGSGPTLLYLTAESPDTAKKAASDLSETWKEQFAVENAVVQVKLGAKGARILEAED